MTDKLISDLSSIGAAIADNTAFEAQRNGQTTTEQALGSDLKAYIQSWLTKTMVGLGNVANLLQLVAASNLSDVASADASRINLSLGFGMSSNRFYAYTDCMHSAPASDHWGGSWSGAGAQLTAAAVGSLNAAGILSLDLGTTTTGRAAIISNGLRVFRLGQGRTRFLGKCAIHTLSDGTNTYTTRLGFMISISGEGNDGVFFRYTDGVNSGKWQAVCRNNSTETAVDTGIAPVADTWHLMSIDVNAAGTSVSFFIDGAQVGGGAVTTNIPTTSGHEVGYGVMSLKSAGTTATSGGYVDAMEVELDFTSAR